MKELTVIQEDDNEEFSFYSTTKSSIKTLDQTNDAQVKKEDDIDDEDLIERNSSAGGPMLMIGLVGATMAAGLGYLFMRKN